MLEHIELKLLAGYPIETDGGLIYQPKIKDIVDIGEEKYQQYLGLLLFDTDLIEIKDKELQRVEMDEFTTFDFLYFLSVLNENTRSLVEDSLRFFFRKDILTLNDYRFCVGHFGEQKFITRDNYNYIKKVLIKMNFLKELEEEEEIEFGNELARQWYLEAKKVEKNRPKPKPQINLQSIISAMMWRTNKTTEQILDMTVYQLHDGYHRLFLIDECLGLRDGLYHGTVDKSKINPNDLNWAKIIEFNNQ